MITKILSKIGLPFLVKFIGQALGSINNDQAKQASLLLGDVDTAIQQRQISVEELKEANRHMEKSAELEASVDEKTLNTIHQTIRKEMDTGDKFVRFWRPAFGYSMALAWLMNMFTVCYVIMSENPDAAEIILSLAETTPLWGIALGVLGISVVKSTPEKTNGLNLKSLKK